jgi:hypothetical protein
MVKDAEASSSKPFCRMLPDGRSHIDQFSPGETPDLEIYRADLQRSLQVCHQQFGFSNIKFVYVLWGFWWLDAALSFISAFGMFYVMQVLVLVVFSVFLILPRPPV